MKQKPDLNQAVIDFLKVVRKTAVLRENGTVVFCVGLIEFNALIETVDLSGLGGELRQIDIDHRYSEWLLLVEQELWQMAGYLVPDMKEFDFYSLFLSGYTPVHAATVVFNHKKPV